MEARDSPSDVGQVQNLRTVHCCVEPNVKTTTRAMRVWGSPQQRRALRPGVAAGDKRNRGDPLTLFRILVYNKWRPPAARLTVLIERSRAPRLRHRVEVERCRYKNYETHSRIGTAGSDTSSIIIKKKKIIIKKYTTLD